MAKGQKRSNREAKKPKAAVKKPVAGISAPQYQLPKRGPDAAKDGTK